MCKPLINGLPPFRPILSAIGTPTYKLVKFLVPVLSDITQNGFTVKDSFTFVDEILTQSSDLYMASLDVDALFTNIPLDETIDICLKKLFKTPDTLVKGISKNDFRKGMLMILLCFSNHLNLPTCFTNIYPLNIRT